MSRSNPARSVADPCFQGMLDSPRQVAGLKGLKEPHIQTYYPPASREFPSQAGDEFFRFGHGHLCIFG